VLFVPGTLAVFFPISILFRKNHNSKRFLSSKFPVLVKEVFKYKIHAHCNSSGTICDILYRIHMMIIPATESHIPEIVEIWKEFMDFHSHLDLYFTRTDEGSSKFEEWLRSLMKSDNALVLTAKEDDQVIAYSLSQICKRPPLFTEIDYGYIYDLAVKSEYRRKGIGEQMLSEILG